MTTSLKNPSIEQSMGMDEKKCEKSSSILNKLLADFFTLYVKTLGCHWNIEDPRFFFSMSFLKIITRKSQKRSILLQKK